MSAFDVTAEVGYAIQLALAGMFGSAAITKLRSPRAFVATVVEYDLLPPATAPVAAAAVVGAEGGVAGLLVTGFASAYAFLVSGLLLATFAIAGAITLMRRKQIRCGCFGKAGETVSRRSLVRLVILLVGVATAAVIVSAAKAPVTVTSAAAGGSAAGAVVFESATLALALAASFSWLVRLPELIEIARDLRPTTFTSSMVDAP